MSIMLKPRRLLMNWTERYLWKNRVILNSYGDGERASLFGKISEITQEADLRASHITVNEASQLFNATRATNKLPGSLAEVGVYRGGTAKIICEAKGDRPLYLFDTFEGLPEAEQRKRRWVLSRRSVFLPLIIVQKYL